VDVHYIYQGQSFAWDSRKAASNRVKHGIAFETACEVFFDPLSTFLDARPERKNGWRWLA
jgi:uncharacterized DUF497 family protein